jgi:DNA-binding transcriptional LysR family regulator
VEHTLVCFRLTDNPIHGRLPTFVAGADLKSGRLINLLESHHIPDQTFYAVFPTREYLPTKVRVFIDFAIEHLGGDQPYWDT